MVVPVVRCLVVMLGVFMRFPFLLVVDLGGLVLAASMRRGAETALSRR
jgi:hypothetical protein